MKRFLVILDDEADYDFAYRRRSAGDGGDGIAYVYLQHKTDWMGNFSKETKVYGVNSAEEAQFLAQHLSAKFAPQQYLAAEVSMVYKAEIGPVKAAKFSDKGLLPV